METLLRIIKYLWPRSLAMVNQHCKLIIDHKPLVPLINGKDLGKILLYIALVFVDLLQNMPLGSS